MDEETRKRFEEETKEQYVAIGRFVVHFEHMCEALMRGITFFLGKSGIVKQEIITILLADLTAKHLHKIFQSLIPEIIESSDLEKQIVNNIMKRCQNLIEKRNIVIHNAWYIGWASPSQTEFSEVSAMKPHSNKKGGGYKVTKYTTNDFLKLVDEVDELKMLIDRLWGCSTDIGKISIGKIERNFILDSKGNVHVPDKSCIPPRIP